MRLVAGSEDTMTATTMAMMTACMSTSAFRPVEEGSVVNKVRNSKDPAPEVQNYDYILCSIKRGEADLS
jgi:hypothetical protein